MNPKALAAAIALRGELEAAKTRADLAIVDDRRSPPPAMMPAIHFRADQARLDRERDEWAGIIQESIERYQARFGRVCRERMRARRAARRAAINARTMELAAD